SELPPAGFEGDPPQYHAGPLAQLQFAQVSLSQPELHEGGQHPEPGQLCQPGQP
ncbi:hypothetical protein SRHO_G00129360, partial [Serrasalmus rhombeus]